MFHRLSIRPSLRLTIVAFCLIMIAAAAKMPAADPQPVRLRFEWGGGEPRLWNGVLEIDTGRYERPLSLSMEADEPGSLWADGAAVLIQRRTARVYDGFDVTAVAAPDARVTLTLQSSERPEEHVRHEFVLADLLKGPRTMNLGAGRGRLIIRRTPGDALAINMNRPHLIFTPRERFAAEARINVPLPQQPGLVRLQWRLTPARDGKILKAGTLRVDRPATAALPPPVPIAFTLPAEEGVYDLSFSLAARGVKDVTSTVQVVVISPQPPAETAEHPHTAPGGTLVDSFHPRTAGYRRRVEPRTGLGLLPPSWSRWIDQAQAAETSPDMAAARLKWKAYTLQVLHPGRPHRLVVSLPAEFADAVGISLLEPNAAGQLMPSGLDLALLPDKAVGETVPTAPSQGAVMRELLFWPRVNRPILFLHDLGTGHAAEIETVELYELQQLNGSPAASRRQWDPSQRLVGPYLQKPVLPECFGATEAYDAGSGRSLDDWVTFHTAATRLVDYLHAAGHNSLMLAALADGSTIYPSAQLQPTPRYDTGIFFSTGQDPFRKDVLELLFRVFDREGLVLVPALQFATPLPALETAIAQGGETTRSIELIGRDGRSWREARGMQRGLAPYYNPLDPRVQQAVLAVVREVVDRYKTHESFQGLAVELSSDGYLQLPGLDWGYDDETIARFEQATGVRVPAVEGRSRYERRFEFLTTEARAAWIRWRCAELMRLHQQIAAVVTASKPTAQFILAGHRTLAGENPDDRLGETLTSGGNLESLLPPKGLDFSQLGELPRVLVLRPAAWSVADGTGRQGRSDAANFNQALDRAFCKNRFGLLLAHHPSEHRVTDFDDVSPWQPAFTWLAARPWPAAIETRKRYARALANDARALFDGGLGISVWTDPDSRAARDILRSLPAVEFRLNEVQRQPAVVRLARHKEQTLLLVVNDFAGPSEVTLHLTCPPTTESRRLPDSTPLSLAADGKEGSMLNISLEPYGVWACQLRDTNVRISHVEARPSNAALALQRRQILRFDHELAQVHQQGTSMPARLGNPGFEESAAMTHGPEGWQLVDGEAVEWRLDRENPRSGLAALALATESNSAAVTSQVSLDRCRLATLSAWLRTDGQPCRARLALEITSPGERYIRDTEVRIDSQWRRYSFRIDDLPPGRLDAATLRIELRDSGKIWVDDVEVQLHRVTENDLRQLTKVFSALTLAWEERRYADCERLLESYWGRLLLDSESPRPPDSTATIREAVRSTPLRQQ